MTLLLFDNPEPYKTGSGQGDPYDHALNNVDFLGASQSIGGTSRCYWQCSWTSTGTDEKTLRLYTPGSSGGSTITAGTKPWYCRVRWVANKTAPGYTVSILRMQTCYVSVWHRTDGKLELRATGGTPQVGATAIAANTEYELLLVVHSTSHIELYVDGVEECDMTDAALVAGFNNVEYVGMTPGKGNKPYITYKYRDLWANDSDGSIHNSTPPTISRYVFYGPGSGAEQHSEFFDQDDNAATYDEWDEYKAGDDDTTYNKPADTSAVQRECNPIALISDTAAIDTATEHIEAVILTTVCEHLSGTTKNLSDCGAFYYLGGTEYDGQPPSSAVSLAYINTWPCRLDPVDPNTGSAWLKAGLEAGQIGAYKPNANDCVVKHTRVYAMVALEAGAEPGAAAARRIFIC